ncbi:MAG: DUF2442 domain-containing protein [Spirochaetota bacterium]
MLPPRIQNVTPLPPTKVRLEYIDGQVRVFDMEPLLDKGIFCALRDPAFFMSARADIDTVAWPNGADVEPQWLYEDSVPEVTT